MVVHVQWVSVPGFTQSRTKQGVRVEKIKKRALCVAQLGRGLNAPLWIFFEGERRV